MSEVYEKLLQAILDGRRAALVSEFGASGTVKTLVDDAGAEWESLAETPEGVGIEEAGGTLTMTEFFAARPRMIILGGGHIALPLSNFGAGLGFKVTVYDDRPSFANAARFPGAETVICDSFENAGRLTIREDDYVVIVTRGHKHDSLCMREILRGVFPRYVGMIGSRRRIAIVKKQLGEETGELAKLERLHAPIGLSIGAVTPEEIAVSIVAEIIGEKRLGADKHAGSELYPDMELLRELAGGLKGAALVTVVETDGSTPREAGAKMAVLPHGRTVGSIGGGCAEAEVMQEAMEIIRGGGYRMMEIDLTDSAEEDGMVCGGTMKALIERI